MSLSTPCLLNTHTHSHSPLQLTPLKRKPTLDVLKTLSKNCHPGLIEREGAIMTSSFPWSCLFQVGLGDGAAFKICMWVFNKEREKQSKGMRVKRVWGRALSLGGGLFCRVSPHTLTVLALRSLCVLSNDLGLWMGNSSSVDRPRRMVGAASMLPSSCRPSDSIQPLGVPPHSTRLRTPNCSSSQP